MGVTPSMSCPSLLSSRSRAAVLGLVLSLAASVSARNETNGKAFSLFSIVQFPNQQCTASSSTTTYGTCYTSSECTTKGGSADGNCAAGFGVCCVITTSTCSSSISTNTTYIRNPNYPSFYTPTSGACGVDDFEAAGQTGKNPPTICGTNTGYHMYVEFGVTSTDTITLTNTYRSGGLTTAKTFNILLRQISCTARWKAPTDCVQYFTGKSGSVKSYNFAGSQFLQSQIYNNCIRTEKGYCAIQWKESSTTSPDPFDVGTTLTAIESDGCDGLAGFVLIPNLSQDGIQKLPIPVITTYAFQSQVCGSNFGIEGMGN